MHALCALRMHARLSACWIFELIESERSIVPEGVGVLNCIDKGIQDRLYGEFKLRVLFVEYQRYAFECEKDGSCPDEFFRECHVCEPFSWSGISFFNFSWVCSSSLSEIN